MMLRQVNFQVLFNIPELAQRYEEVFIYLPDKKLRSFLEKEQGAQLESVFDNKLYRLERPLL